ncbi:MAG: MOSC domain-containing protein [Myxococcota bacterium]|jgi:hypothetical protein|nr:MOSC domain-containing protein [Myxococcota bacterium]
MRLCELHVYPLKSGAGIALNEAFLEARGLQGDRRWLVVDANGRFLSARTHPRMLLIKAIPDEKGLYLSAPGVGKIHVPLPNTAQTLGPVSIWKDTCNALYLSQEADRWLSDFLGTPSHLVYMSDDITRPVNKTDARPGDIVSFADAYPLLLTSKASLVDLNKRLAKPIEMPRFRANLVVDGIEAFAEDKWQRLRLGEIEFDCASPCTRCVLTTIDPLTANKDPQGEPLKTLKTYRQNDEGVLFGINLIPRAQGKIRVGDTLEVLV